MVHKIVGGERNGKAEFTWSKSYPANCNEDVHTTLNISLWDMGPPRCEVLKEVGNK